MVCQPQPFADLVTPNRESICGRLIGEVTRRDETLHIHRTGSLLVAYPSVHYVPS
jgi:hypothetical protein